MPEAFKLDNLKPFKPLLFLQFSIYLTFILGGLFFLTQSAKREKGKIFSIPEMDEPGGYQGLGPSNWTICSLLSPFCPGNFQFLSLLYKGLILRKG